MRLFFNSSGKRKKSLENSKSNAVTINEWNFNINAVLFFKLVGNSVIKPFRFKLTLENANEASETIYLSKDRR